MSAQAGNQACAPGWLTARRCCTRRRCRGTPCSRELSGCITSCCWRRSGWDRRFPAPVGDRLSDVMFVFLWAAVPPLAALLLVVLPACLLWALFVVRQTGLFGRVGRIACLTSMFFSGTYFAIILGIVVFALVAGEPASEPGHGYRIPAWWPFVNLVVLPVGFLATWRSWRRLRRAERPQAERRNATATGGQTRLACPADSPRASCSRP